MLQKTLALMEEPFTSKNLFSPNFLVNRLPKEDARWHQDEAQNKMAFDKIKKIFDKTVPEKNDQYRHNESNLEKDLIRPILDILGHSYDVNESIHFKYRGVQRPDYTFFPSDEIRKESAKDTQKYLSSVIGLGEAKAWDVNLDKTTRGDPNNRTNPSLQICNYLRDTGKPWGILTNGRLWRIYNKETSLQLDSYYEINLKDIIENGSSEDFKYFFYFFRREAFIREIDENFLDSVLSQSINYSKKLEADVKENVYDALRLIIKGIINHPDNSPSDREIEKIQGDSLIILYRLLFILFGEAKGLLPLDNQVYRAMSLQKIREDIKHELDVNKGITYSVSGEEVWTRLKILFKVINEGSLARGIEKKLLFIPPYNGGLFDDNKHEYLNGIKIGDKYLVEAVHLLSWSQSDTDNQSGFIDYKSLSIRHLGSIYEGLLEYKPTIADDDLVVVREKGREVYKKISEADLSEKKLKKSIQIHKGDVYLKTDRGERKTTGSFYTPDFVVKHIVEQTLEPVLESIRNENKKGLDYINGILSIKVLDPAMGSGHFLVEAITFLATKIVEEISDQAIDIGDTGFDDALWARREVATHCIYGVDINPLAVELAKVSIWLHTLTADKPLSFLDHHLKCGNSLIGAKVVDIAWLPTERPKNVVSQIDRPFGFLLKIKKRLDDLESISEGTIEDVKEKEEKYQQLKASDEYTRMKTLADVHTGICFSGLSRDLIRKKYMDIVNETYYGNKDNWQQLRTIGWIRDSLKIADDKQFFHWELEFPEVFFRKDSSEDIQGFDAVVGNPPYVRMELIKDVKSYLEIYYDSYAGRADIYVYFLELMTKLLRPGSYGSYIVSNKFFKVKYGRDIRSYLSQNTTIQEVINFEDLPIFEDATTYVAIITLVNRKPSLTDSLTYTFVPDLNFNDICDVIEQNSRPFQNSYLDESEWAFITPEERDLLNRLEKQSKHLEEIITSPTVGVKTGLNDVYFVTEDKVTKLTNGDEEEASLFRKCIIGSDIEAYSIKSSGKMVLFPYKKDDLGNWIPIDVSGYPNVKNYLLESEKDLKKRAIIKDELELSQTRWYEYQQINKELDFDKPLLVYRDLAEQACFSMTKGGEVVDMTAFILPIYNNILLALLNSKLFVWVVGLRCARARGGWYRFKTQYINRLPIKISSESRPIHLIEDCDEELRQKLSELSNGELWNAIKNEEKLECAQDNVIAKKLEENAAYLTNECNNKQTEIDNFIHWIEVWTKSNINLWKEKTKIQNYYLYDFPTIHDVFRKNQKIININIGQRVNTELLSNEFLQSLQRLDDIKSGIQNVKEQSDLLTYQLYGLTCSDVELIEDDSRERLDAKYNGR